MKKIFYCFLLLTFFVLSCSKEEADMDGSQNKVFTTDYYSIFYR